MNNPDKSKLEKFLSRRDSIVTTIEIATALLQQIGGNPLDLSHHGINNYQIGCIIQFFNFYQKILTDSIFRIISDLKSIRQRYANARNDLICHINDDVENHAGIATVQIVEDIEKLRDIINAIRIANDIPRVVSITSRDDQYPIKGFHEILEIFKGSSKSICA